MAKKIHNAKRKVVRVDIGDPFVKMLEDLVSRVNEERMNNWNITCANRRVILEAWRRAFPDKEVPADAMGMVKPYYKDLPLDNVHSG